MYVLYTVIHPSPRSEDHCAGFLLMLQLLMALACVLRVQDAASWNIASTNNAFKSLLDFTLHKKHRVSTE